MTRRQYTRLHFKPRACLHCAQMFQPDNNRSQYCSVACALWSRVQRGSADECWPWLGGITGGITGGYGQFRWRAQILRPHVVAWELAHGAKMPSGRLACHTCHNPRCCNPAHLVPGTLQENMAQRDRRERPYFDKRRRERPAPLIARAALTAHEQESILASAAQGISRTKLALAFGVPLATVSSLIPKKVRIPRPPIIFASLEEKVRSRCIQDEQGCLLWTGAKTKFGHGKVAWEGSLITTHRAMWKVTHGEIPQGMCVLHQCDVPACCNPDHLFLGTQATNMADMIAKQRKPRGEIISIAVKAAWTTELRARHSKWSRENQRKRREARAAAAGVPLDWKYCAACQTWYPRSNFHRNAARDDGLASRCNACKSIETIRLRKKRLTMARPQ